MKPEKKIFEKISQNNVTPVVIESDVNRIKCSKTTN